LRGFEKHLQRKKGGKKGTTRKRETATLHASATGSRGNREAVKGGGQDYWHPKKQNASCRGVLSQADASNKKKFEKESRLSKPCV